MATGKKRWNKLTDDQKKNTYSSYTGVAPEHVDLTGMDYNDLPKDVKKGVKQSQLKAKLLKIKLANKRFNKLKEKEIEAKRKYDDYENINDPDKYDVNKGFRLQEKYTNARHKTREYVRKGALSTAKSKVNKLKKKYVDPNPQAETPEEIMQSAESAGREPSYIAQEHGHRISFRAHSAGNYKTASLNEQSGKYAKYWLLNAKDTNGNGWGIAAHTAKDNMKKFIGRPLVVTASSWHGASEYGDQYEHPYLPTNDITAILDHQEKFRVGSIVDVVEDSHGDWYANVEMLPKFANSRLPPFCSPAIYQLDASEAEGQISKWEALHLAALTENPAYGARIALLKGTCVGTGSECKVQFKSAKQKTAEINLDKHTKRMREIINDPYSATEVEDNKDLEYPVTKWDGGEEYAVFSNKSGKPLLDNKFDSKYPPKNIEFLKQFDNAEDALDYSEYRHSDEYGGSIFSNDKHYIGLEKKFKENRYTTKPGESKRDIHELDNPNKYASIECPKKKQKISSLKQRLSASGMPDDFAKDPDPFPKNKKLDFNDRENGRGGRQLKIFKKGDSGGMFDRTKGPLEKEVPFGKVKGKNKNLSGQPVSQTPADIQRENKKTDKYLDKGTKIRPLKPTQADRRKIITAKEEDPTEKVIREVKDPEKKKDLLNRLDEKPNEYGPKNYGATKPKNFGKKIGKLKSRIAAVDQLDLGGNVQNRIPTGKKKYGPGGFLVDQDTIDAFRNKKPYRMNTKLKGRKKEYAFQSDGTSLYQLTPDVPQKRYTIARWNDKGNLDWSFQGHDSDTTILAGRMLGIDIERRKDGLYINGELIDHQSMDFTEIAKENLADGFVSKSKGKKKEMTPEQYKTTLEQSSFQIKSRKKLKEEKDSFDSENKSEHGELLDRTVVQPNQKKKINKTLGLDKEHNIPPKTYGNILDHSIPAKTLKKMGLPRDTPMAITGATPVSHKSHMEREHPKSSIPETFYPKKPKFDPARLKRKTFGVSPNTLKMSKLKTRLAVTASKKIPTSKVEGFAPLPNKRGDVSEFAKSLRTKKRDIYEELGHEKGKTVPYNIVKRPNRYTHKEEYEKGKKQFVDHIHARNNRPQETMNYMKKHGIHEEFEENRKQLSVAERREKGIGTGFDHPNIAGYTAENAVRWSKLKTRLANLGEQNMTYQDSKKVKIHKKKNMEKHDKS